MKIHEDQLEDMRGGLSKNIFKTLAQMTDYHKTGDEGLVTQQIGAYLFVLSRAENLVLVLKLPSLSYL